ncbi:MAG: OmpA family protein [Sandaracinaceae bacterium]
MTRCISFATVLFLIGCASGPPLRLRRVVLYQNGVGYFEHAARTSAPTTLPLRPHEVDDVVATLTVLGAPDTTPTVVLPDGDGETREMQVSLPGASGEAGLAYSAPTSAWRASYRLLLPEDPGSDQATLQAWAVIDNTTANDWDDVELILATDAPLSFAIDLRTPREVARPNVTGHRTPPVALGPVRSEHSSRDVDQDSVPDLEDGCPGGACDRDGDRLTDFDDQCPDLPETYTGVEDEDGCPDTGRVTVSESSLHILERLYFASGSSTIQPASTPILDAMAATLNGNPQITGVRVEGHADSSEARPWLISAERAEGVRRALIERGVDGARLETQAYAATRPIHPTERERNRRVGFDVVSQSDGPPPRPPAVSRASRSPLPESRAGTRFPVARSVTVPAGGSAMVRILEDRVAGQDVLLYRVDAAVPSSREHPFRAARLGNRSGVDLAQGPVSLFAGGELRGQGLLDPLSAGDNAFVPYAVDPSSRVTRRDEEERSPSRVVSLRAGRVELEDVVLRRATYVVEAGARAPRRIFVVHPIEPGYEPRALPAGTERRPGVVLVPAALEPGGQRTLVVERARPVRRTVDLRTALDVRLTAYLEASSLRSEERARLTRIIEAREVLRQVQAEVGLRNGQLRDAAARTAELRETVESLDVRAGGSAGVFRRRMAEQLTRATEQAEGVAEALAALRSRDIEARARLREATQPPSSATGS